MSKAKIGIINVTSYMGAEVARLLYRHPGIELSFITGRSEAGKKLGQVFPHLSQLHMVIDSAPGEADLVFSALPHKAGAETIAPLVDKGVRVIDLSADFRLRDSSAYPLWYGFEHPVPGLLEEAVYGLTEMYRSKIQRAQLVANPGCYPTSAILALAPASKAGLLHGDVIVDSKSGLSGAGRALSLKAHYAEANESVVAYALEGHRHLPEIVQEVEAIKEGAVALTFVPHLVPMTRGILSTCYAPSAGKLSAGERGIAELRQIYRDFYQGEQFVQVVDELPQTKHTLGTNICLVYPTIDLRTNRLTIVSCLDNLVKGGSGQAVQNMNVMLGYSESTGLEQLAVYP